MELVRKYPNRKYYHLGTSSYINLTVIENFIKDGKFIKVTEVVNQEARDITTKTLASVLLKREKAALQALSIDDLAARVRN